MRQIESEKDTLNRAYRLRQFAKEFNVDKLTVIAEYGEYVHCGVTYRTLLGFGGGIKIYSEPKLSNDQAREIRKELYKGARINEVCSYEDYEEANFSVKEVS